MLDHQHRAIHRHPFDQGSDPRDVFAAHARGRLVEQHHLGLERQGGGDLERALTAVRQIRGLHVGVLGQPDFFEQLQRTRVQGLERGLGAPELERVAELALQSDAHILD